VTTTLPPIGRKRANLALCQRVYRTVPPGTREGWTSAAATALPSDRELFRTGGAGTENSRPLWPVGAGAGRVRHHLQGHPGLGGPGGRGQGREPDPRHRAGPAPVPARGAGGRADVVPPVRSGPLRRRGHRGP